MKYRKKPVVIDATQWYTNGDHPDDHLPFGKATQPTETDRDRYNEYLQTNSAGTQAAVREGKVVRYYRHPGVPGSKPCEQCGKPHHVHGWIDTLEQGHRVCPGDWIITGVKGEHYPVKDEIFRLTYEPVVAHEF